MYICISFYIFPNILKYICIFRGKKEEEGGGGGRGREGKEGKEISFSSLMYRKDDSMHMLLHFVPLDKS
jgi:hypothetical protein